jgi:3-oxoacyl-ACP reductase-like protein
VPPPALWNYEHKEGAKEPPSGSTPGPTSQSPSEAGPEAASAQAPGTAAAKPVDAELEAQELLAVMEANAALEELDEHIAALEDLVSRLPE